MSTVNVSQLTQEHTQWLKDLDFYIDEIKVLEGRLTEVVRNNNKRAVMQQVEHFQNQFIIQKNTIAELRHDIHENYEKAAEDSRHMAGHMQDIRVETQDKLRSEYDAFESVYGSLKQEYNRFLSEVM